ncbi:MAG: insulinase family protein [Deferrisomatales bacterium]|nr:insulinase family protein [Deferrisomatales bacterium]
MAELGLHEGDSLHGFHIHRITPLEELNATLAQLEHAPTGARWLHLASADDNNLFAVGFRTPPPDSTGAPHILEHTVLCGSRKYPVHDPFFAMLRRSLSTFMNALTADDWTLYPFSTQNRKDFYNLMAVYLDAAFFPLLRERDFRQEGHRLEFADPEAPTTPLQIKGVVYNEMKGHMSDPRSLLGTRVAEALYPTTPYGKNAGGEPRHIPDLTWEGLKAFHAACYHPSNAYFFSYGDLPLEPHLAFAAREVLGAFGRIDPGTAVGVEERFSSPRKESAGYPIDAGEPTAGKAMVQVAWLTCPITDHTERLGLDLLSELLLGNPAAPLHKALLDSKLGANLAPGSGFLGENRETHFAAGLQGTEPERTEAIEALVLETLEEASRTGFTRERIEGAIQQVELAHREVRGDHYPYALSLLSRVMGPWIHGAEPAEALRVAERLAEIRGAVAAGPYFEELIHRQLLENPHRVTLTLRPDPDLKARQEAEEAARVAAVRERLSEADRQELVERARELREAQEAEEDVSVLPSVGLEDIPREERPVSSEVEDRGAVSLGWFDQPTNGIGYFLAHVEAGGVRSDLSPYLPFFCAALPLVGAAGQPYTAIAERIAAATGGVGAGVGVLDNPEGGGVRAVLEVTGKALVPNLDKLYGILADLLGSADFTDRERLHTILNQLRVNLENSLPAMGHRYAARAAAATLTPGAQLRESWSGVEYIRFVRGLAGKRPEELGPAAGQLAAIAGALPCRERMACAVTGEARAFPQAREAVAPFLSALRTGSPPAQPGPPAPWQESPARLGLAASLPVSYVARVFRGVPYTHPDAPGLTVLAKLLKAGYLHREIRERGGAYGGMAGYAPEAGLFSLLSYRDPHVVRTLRVFADAARWAAAGRFSAQDVKEAVLGVFSDLDTPLSPAGKAAREFANQRQGLSRELRQRFREGLLAASSQGLSSLAERYLVAGRPGSAVAVLAGEEALQRANEELGDEALEIRRV